MKTWGIIKVNIIYSEGNRNVWTASVANKHNNQNTSDYIMNVSRDCKNPMLLSGH